MKTAYWLFLPALLCFAACKNEPANAIDETATVTNPVVDSTTVLDNNDPYFIKKYLGNINGALTIEMVLINWGDGYLSGRYWYQGKGIPLELSGELKDDRNFEIFESSEGKETGLFTGSLSDPSHLAGIWTDAAKRKNLNFELHEMAPDTDETGWTGNWHLTGVWDSGTLMIGNVSKDSFDFALFILRGSHTGTIEGRAALNGKKALFSQKEFEDEPCVLEFSHQGSSIKLDQPSSNFACGFGARAFAGGEYERKQREVKAVLKVGAGEDAIFPTQAQHDAFLKLVGEKAYESFAFNMQAIQKVTGKSGKIVVTGFVPGLVGTNEAIIIFDQQGKMWAATIEYDELNTETFVRYFTNDPLPGKKMPAEVEIWREGFRDLRLVL